MTVIFFSMLILLFGGNGNAPGYYSDAFDWHYYNEKATFFVGVEPIENVAFNMVAGEGFEPSTFGL